MSDGTRHKQVRLFIGNIPFRTSKQEVADFCRVVGNVIEVKIPTERDSEKIKGYAFATVMLKDNAPDDDWKRLDKRMMGERQVNVEEETGRRR